MKTKENMVIIVCEGDTAEYRRLPVEIVKKALKLMDEEVEFRCCKRTVYFDEEDFKEVRKR